MGIFQKNRQPEPEQPQREAPAKKGFWNRIAQGLTRTRSELAGKLGRLIEYYANLDEDFFEELEAVLISSDMGVTATEEIITALRERTKKERISDSKEITRLLREEISRRLQVEAPAQPEPLLILVVGVNGVGKTTMIGKLAYRYAQQGKRVLLAAGDTFRAAAAEQLAIWAERSGAQIVRHGEGADSAAVIFDAISAAKARKTDVVICDTAGRLQNKKNLMDELAKVSRIIDRNWEGGRETFLVVDATTGQNALVQAKTFREAAPLTGIVLTKLDGTAKGGVVVAIESEIRLPVRYVGVGEGKEDLMEFDPDAFAANIF